MLPASTKEGDDMNAKDELLKCLGENQDKGEIPVPAMVVLRSIMELETLAAVRKAIKDGCTDGD